MPAPRRLSALLLSPFLIGCFDLGLDPDYEVQGCTSTPITSASVTESLKDRYARGSYAKLSVGGLENPEVTSDAPDIVEVSTIEDDRVFLRFAAVGTAVIHVVEAQGSSRRMVEVAEVEGFEVVTPIPRIPNAGRALIDPTFSVRYLDGQGRLHGVGLAESSWPRRDNSNLDVFYDDGLSPGLHEVAIRVGARQTIVEFDVVADEDVGAVWLLETDLGNSRIRVDLVGLTASGTLVWNMAPFFQIDGELFIDSFQYELAPNAPLRRVEGRSVSLGYATEREIRAASVGAGPAPEITSAASASRAPVAAAASLALMAIGLRTRRRVRRTKSEQR